MRLDLLEVTYIQPHILWGKRSKFTEQACFRRVHGQEPTCWLCHLCQLQTLPPVSTADSPGRLPRASQNLLNAHSAAAAATKSFQSCPTLCDPIGGSPPGSAVPGILQARTLEWSCYFFLQCMKVKSEREVPQSCPTLCDPMDCSLPGSSVY